MQTAQSWQSPQSNKSRTMPGRQGEELGSYHQRGAYGAWLRFRFGKGKAGGRGHWPSYSELVSHRHKIFWR